MRRRGWAPSCRPRVLAGEPAESVRRPRPRQTEPVPARDARRAEAPHRVAKLCLALPLGENAEARHRGDGGIIDERLAIDALPDRFDRRRRFLADRRISRPAFVAEHLAPAFAEKERAAGRGRRDLGIELAKRLALGGAGFAAAPRPRPPGPAPLPTPPARGP